MLLPGFLLFVRLSNDKLGPLTGSHGLSPANDVSEPLCSLVPPRELQTGINWCDEYYRLSQPLSACDSEVRSDESRGTVLTRD